MNAEIAKLKEQAGAVILAHYYQRPEIQDVADFIGDSLALARIAQTLPQKVVVMCGVNFMAETVKILCPEKTVLCPEPEAGCSLADSCPAAEFEQFVKEHPEHTVVSYVNTSAAVKALTDIVVTSGNARKVIESLPKDEKIIFGPDKNLGDYINKVTGRNMLLWPGACHVHEQFSMQGILNLKKEMPDAPVLVHPECPRPVQLLADCIGSTAAILDYVQKSPASRFIIATESGILHEMRKRCPGKEFMPAPPQQAGCACNECAYMKMNTLEKLRNCLATLSPEVEVDPAIAERARRPILRMLELS